MKKFVFLFLVVLTFPILATAQKGFEKDKNSQNNEFRSPFRYVIVAGVSELEKYVNRFPNEILHLEVLIEDKAFNEKDLTTLFELLNKRFPPPTVLMIHVYTSLEAIRTPEENENTNLKGPIDNYFDYKNALFIRYKDGTKKAHFSIPNVIMKKAIVIK